MRGTKYEKSSLEAQIVRLWHVSTTQSLGRVQVEHRILRARRPGSPPASPGFQCADCGRVFVINRIVASNNSLRSELRNTWEGAAPGWAKWEHAFATSFSQATYELLDMAGILPGMRVLDIACGAGSQTIQAAERVGSRGKVVASDISAAMLEYARQNAARARLENIETLPWAADELPGTLPPFDAAICRMGLMLFPSPSKALEAIHRVLKPGARFAALVFTTPANNPFLAQPMAILLRHAGEPSPGPGAPGIFGLGANGILESLLKDGGFTGVEMKMVRVPFTLSSARDAVHLMQEAAGAYRAVVANLGEEAKSKAWAEVHQSLMQFESGSGFETELEAIIGSGAKPTQLSALSRARQAPRRDMMRRNRDWSDPWSLSNPRQDRPGRYGRGLPRARHAPQPRCRPESPARVVRDR